MAKTCHAYLSGDLFVQRFNSILLLVSFCLVISGYHLFFHYKISRARSEMRAFLQNQKNHKDVIEFSFGNKELDQLEWENSNEFRYKNEMYDVIEKKTESGKLTVRCIADKKETQLLTEYQKTHKSNSNKTAIQLITAQFVLPVNQLLQQPETILKKKFIDHSFSLPDPFSVVASPPPDVC